MKEKRIGVIGDIMLDKYIEGDVERVSPEAPVPIVLLKKRYNRLGGASNVLLNLSKLRKENRIMGIIGKDEDSKFIKKEFHKNYLNTKFIIEDSNYTTITKLRVIGKKQQLIRIDNEIDISKNKYDSKLIEYIDDFFIGIDYLIISDYNKGLFDKNSINYIIKKAKEKKIRIIVDSKPNNYDLFKNIYAIKPNKNELEKYMSVKIHSIEDAVKYGKMMKKRLNSEILILTLGRDGVILINEDVYHVPALEKDIVDVTGAGDTFIASFCHYLASEESEFNSVYKSNIAASLVVKKLGTAFAEPKEVEKIFNSKEIFPNDYIIKK